MSTDNRTDVTAPEASGDIVERIEQTVLSRRSFLTGLGVGGAVGAGLVGLARPEAGFQSKATLASGAALPMRTQYHLPAVDSSDGGIVVGVEFAFSEGSGELFVDLDGAEVSHDIQLALREAVQTATGLTGRSLSELSTHVTFETPGSRRMALRGKSWEGGLTVALVAALRQQPLTEETLITGIVDREGTLLPVGGIEGKARAARAFGATELVIPAGQDTDVHVEGLRVTPVETISEALDRIL
ncbi:S16 family serine protease [Haloferax sp. DFSO52]|uniref:S16 family serine protease n=1 Tax=Haloferax sp. DFSO52 TaxID=3388505 RepID=UPI003A897F7A